MVSKRRKIKQGAGKPWTPEQLKALKQAQRYIWEAHASANRAIAVLRVIPNRREMVKDLNRATLLLASLNHNVLSNFIRIPSMFNKE